MSTRSIIREIYTNYPESGYTVRDWDTFPADLALDIDRNGTYEYGIAFTNHDGFLAGNLYNINQWYISNDYAPGKKYTYHENQIVTIKQGIL